MPTDPRIVPVAAFGVGGPLTTTRTLSIEEQANQVQQLLNDLYRASLPESDPLYRPMAPTELDSHVTSLEAWSSYVPDLVTQTRDTLSQQYGFSPTDTGTGGDAAVATAFNSILNTLQRSTTTSTETTRTDQTITRTGSQGQERTTARRVTRFVDLPTPEEFLNDFQTGLATHITALRQSGGLSKETGDWMLANPDYFYDLYLGDLGQRAAKGENIFRVVGQTGEPVRIGQRIGEASEDITSGIDRQAIREVIDSQQRTALTEQVKQTLGVTGTTTSEQDQQITSEVDRLINEQTDRKINEAVDYYGTDRVLTVEEIIARPHLTTVFTVSPIDYLKTQFKPADLETIAAGRRGTRQAEAETARGVAPSAPRRLGG